MSSSILSQDRKMRVLSVGAAAAASLYMLVVFVAEPMRSLAATDTTVVTFDVTSALSLSCDDTSVGSAAGSGTSGSGATVRAKCIPATNDSQGYTLSWIINTGTGAAGSRTGTGHLNSNNAGDRILALDRLGQLTPIRFDSSTIPTGSGARWAARLMETSTTDGGGDVSWEADGDESSTFSKFLNVATGSAVNVAVRTTETTQAGDTENFMYKVVIPSNVFQPTGTYKATITFTATDN